MTADSCFDTLGFAVEGTTEPVLGLVLVDEQQEDAAPGPSGTYKGYNIPAGPEGPFGPCGPSGPGGPANFRVNIFRS